MEKTCTIVVFGGLARRHITEADEVPGPGETIETTKPFTSHTGGRGAFTAVAVHRLSHFKPPDDRLDCHIGIQSAFPDVKINVHLVATVGDDDAGKSLQNDMTECGVNADHVQEVKGVSSIIFVVVDAATKDHRIWIDAAANHILEPDVFQTRGSLNAFAGGRKPALLVTDLELKPETTKQLIKTAGLDGVEVLLNIVPSHAVLPKVLQHVTHLVIHKAEARRSFEDCPTDDDDPKAWARVAKRFIDRGAKNVVITLSLQGAYFANKYGAAGVVRSDRPEDVNNKINSEETFIGAYAAEYVRQRSAGECTKDGQWKIEAAVQRGCKAANYSLSHDGCIYPLPWANEIDSGGLRVIQTPTLLDPSQSSTD